MSESRSHQTRSKYIGRFAPTPSGPLHFGSLVAALASYLDTKAHQGEWLVRIEDIDPPREQPGASQLILQTLEAFELFWDGSVLYQHQQHKRYQSTVDLLIDRGLAYFCRCSRKQLHGYATYPNTCRNRSKPDAGSPCAIRLKTQGYYHIQDRIQGSCDWSMDQIGDFIIQRKDQLFAYQLAVVVDDHYQGINQVVRGYDILESTPRQLQLLEYLGLPIPTYAHIPIIVSHTGQKLSKQNLAPAIDARQKRTYLLKALSALQLKPNHSVQSSSYSDILRWAIENWQVDTLRGIKTIQDTSVR